MGRIVVGVDGSDASRQALQWAVAEARLRGDEVVAIHAWTNPVLVGTFDAILTIPSYVDLDKEASEYLARQVKEVVGDDETVVVGQRITQQPPALALVEESRNADLLVVGSRGMGGFRELLLGSVGHHCAHHAACPVVIIPHTARTKA